MSKSILGRKLFSSVLPYQRSGLWIGTRIGAPRVHTSCEAGVEDVLVRFVRIFQDQMRWRDTALDIFLNQLSRVGIAGRDCHLHADDIMRDKVFPQMSGIRWLGYINAVFQKSRSLPSLPVSELTICHNQLQDSLLQREGNTMPSPRQSRLCCPRTSSINSRSTSIRR